LRDFGFNAVELKKGEPVPSVKKAGTVRKEAVKATKPKIH
jgi:hypothetical protein